MSEPTPVQQKTQKPWYMKWWVWLIAAILVIGGIGAIFNPAPTVAIPDVAGMPAEDAKSALSDLGFKTEFDGGEDAIVISGADWDATGTDPAAGGEAREGARITIFVVEATARLAAEQEAKEQAKAEEAAAREAERAKAAEEAAAAAAVLAAEPANYSTAQQLCDAFATVEFPYGVKMHWIAERYAADQTETGWFLKVGATVTNAFNAERKFNVECHVSGTNGAPVMDDFLYY